MVGFTTVLKPGVCGICPGSISGQKVQYQFFQFFLLVPCGTGSLREVHIFGKADEFYDYGRDGFGYKPQEDVAAESTFFGGIGVGERLAQRRVPRREPNRRSGHGSKVRLAAGGFGLRGV